MMYSLHVQYAYTTCVLVLRDVLISFFFSFKISLSLSLRSSHESQRSHYVYYYCFEDTPRLKRYIDTGTL